jgi:hypothetical protein
MEQVVLIIWIVMARDVIVTLKKSLRGVVVDDVPTSSTCCGGTLVNFRMLLLLLGHIIGLKSFSALPP